MSYPVRTPGSEVEALWRVALYLRRLASKRKGDTTLPPMWFLTDPERTPNPGAIADTLPQGSGVIYRTFGRPEALKEAMRLAEVTRERRLTLLISQDVKLAETVQAHGVHLPQRALSDAINVRRRHPSWLITGAAHDLLSARRAEFLGCDGVFLSAVFPSRSPSAGRPLGVFRLATMARHVACPVFALGGVNAITARRLRGADGLAAIDAFLPNLDEKWIKT